MVEKWFVFAPVVIMAWILLGALSWMCLSVTSKLNSATNSVNYFVDPKKKDWELWETKIPNWRPQKGMQFHKMIVPTADTVRNGFVLDTLVMNNIHALVVEDWHRAVARAITAFNFIRGVPWTCVNFCGNAFTYHPEYRRGLWKNGPVVRWDLLAASYSWS